MEWPPSRENLMKSCAECITVFAITIYMGDTMKYLSIVLLLTAFGFRAAATAQKMEPLPIVLPKPLFEGTPVPPKVPNLEKPLGRPRAAFLAPSGVTNVALRKPVSGSDSDPVIGNLEMITDGVKTGADGS